MSQLAFICWGLWDFHFEEISCHPHWFCSCSQRGQLNKCFRRSESCWHRVLAVRGKKKDTDFKSGWCWWIFKNVIWCFIAWIQMCLRAHVSFALTDVHGPNSCCSHRQILSRTWSQAFIILYRKKKKNKKGEGLYADLCLIRWIVS